MCSCLPTYTFSWQLLTVSALVAEAIQNPDLQIFKSSKII